MKMMIKTALAAIDMGEVLFERTKNSRMVWGLSMALGMAFGMALLFLRAHGLSTLRRLARESAKIANTKMTF